MPLKEIADKLGDTFGPALDAIVEEQSKVSFLHSSPGAQESPRANSSLAALLASSANTDDTIHVSFDFLTIEASIYFRRKKRSVYSYFAEFSAGFALGSRQRLHSQRTHH